MADLQRRTPAGMLAYCDYLMSKGYASASQINPWRTATQKVFEVVEGDAWESLDLTTIELDDYLARFQTLAGAQYKAESVASYKRRIRNALDAHEHYLSTGRPPTFRQRGDRHNKGDEQTAAASKGSVSQIGTTPATSTPASATGGMHDFPFPLGDGRLVLLRLPGRLKSDDVNRLAAFIRTLQDDSSEQRQIPRRVGDEAQEAA